MKRERREYQKTALVAARKVRQMALYWARRCRKSTTLGEMAFDELSKGPGRMVIAASASLVLGRELTGVTLTAAEQGMVVLNESLAQREVFEAGAKANALNFAVANTETGKVMGGLTNEDFAEFFQSGRMELRIYFSRTQYSRQLVIAPNPATARSWRAMVLRDECGFTNPRFEQELRDATDPMMRDTPDLKIIYASNLCMDDRHPYFTTTLPADITAEAEDEQFPANPAGHLYYGQDGMLVHRVALKDAYAAGHVLYDDFGAPMTYEACRAFPQFRSGWDGTYALNHKSGGACVVELGALAAAQRRGVGECAYVAVDSDAAFLRGLAELKKLLKGGRVGVGFDVATTNRESSNPSALTVREQIGSDRFDRLKMAWKERQPQLVQARLQQILAAIAARPAGGGACRLCIDASNERYFAEATADLLGRAVPVRLVVAGQTVEPPPAGYHAQDGRVNYKTWLGDIEASLVNEGRLALPADDYVRADYRMVMKDAGRYVCVPDARSGAHGDLFDSGKLAELALIARSTRSMMVAPSQAAMERVANRRSREILVC